MVELEDVEQKYWVDAGDQLIHSGLNGQNDIVGWTGPYIAHDQIQSAFDDPDVVVCDIEVDDSDPIVYLELQDGGEDDWPALSNRQLWSLAAERFRQQEYGDVRENVSTSYLMNRAIKCIGDARASSAVDYESDLLVEEHLADALNYTLFALERWNDE